MTKKNLHPKTNWGRSVGRGILEAVDDVAAKVRVRIGAEEATGANH